VDGASIVAWSEVEGEEQLMIYAADNGAPPRQVGRQEPGWHSAPAVSPDGKKIAWGDHRYRLMVADAATGAPGVADTGAFEIREYEWSPDSRYIAYALMMPNGLGQVRVWDASTKTTHPVTDPMFNSYSPTWDPRGKFLYFLSDRFINPYLDRLEARFIIQNTALPCVVALQDGGRLPFAPRGDLDPKPERKTPDKVKEKEGKEKKAEPIRIDFDGLGERIVQMPVPPGQFSGLRAVEGKLHWIGREPRGMMPPGEPNHDDDEAPEPGRLVTYDIANEKLATLAGDVLGYDLSLNGKVLVYRTKEGFFRVEAGAMSVPKPGGEDATAGGAGGDDTRIDLSAKLGVSSATSSTTPRCTVSTGPVSGRSTGRWRIA
jgi:tricorn protease